MEEPECGAKISLLVEFCDTLVVPSGALRARYARPLFDCAVVRCSKQYRRVCSAFEEPAIDMFASKEVS